MKEEKFTIKTPETAEVIADAEKAEAPEDEVVVVDGSQDQNAGGSQTMASPDYGEIEEEIVNFDSEDSSNMYLMGTQSEFNIF